LIERMNNSMASSSTSGDLFYMEYYYDTPLSGSSGTAQKNGNLANVRWQRLGTTMFAHTYGYNIYNELTCVTYFDADASGNLIYTSKYGENYTYYKNGKISVMARKGEAGTNIDLCSYTYQAASNKLARVSDSANNPAGFNRNGMANSGSVLTYDANGNQISDLYRNVASITYNHLDLPTSVLRTDGSKLEMTYSASGELLQRKTYLNGGVLSEIKDYIGNYEFIGNAIEAINHSQGRYKRTSTTEFRHEYVLADQVGSTRIVYSDLNLDDNITVSDIIDENHYYAYGLEYTGAGYINGGYPYKFNGIERVESYNMDFALYRGLDPILGRWYQVDPKAEAMMGMSPYCAMNNNPVTYADPNGDIAPLVLGAIIGAFVNVGIQSYKGNINNFGDFLGSALVGGVAGGVGAGVGAGISTALAGGSFGAGFLGTTTVASSGFWAGAASGAGGGFSGGFLSGFGNTLLNGGNIGNAFSSGLNSGSIDRWFSWRYFWRSSCIKK
jgi:RHS repeat-associated protein